MESIEVYYTLYKMFYLDCSISFFIINSSSSNSPGFKMSLWYKWKILVFDLSLSRFLFPSAFTILLKQWHAFTLRRSSMFGVLLSIRDWPSMQLFNFLTKVISWDRVRYHWYITGGNLGWLKSRLNSFLHYQLSLHI